MSDWTKIAEIIGTAGVIISLVFLVRSVNENTRQISSQVSDLSYQAQQDMRLLAIADPEFLEIINTPMDELDQLTESQFLRYREWVIINVDEWERLHARDRDGLISEENLKGWQGYFIAWFQRHVSDDVWQDIRWRHTTPNFRSMLDALIESRQ